MKLLSLLHRRPAKQVPLLPAIDPDTGRRARRRPTAPHGSHSAGAEELLERLLTPTELDLVLHHRI
ncbi:hypothetical protein [Nocardia sp. CNY236]|uniref:hypothetical protein n=1 Tax=Nocardia sp. CNY236 TaxID=1169152 RepID=UPI00040AE38F|nr:hypothetical protein [Nocardia sp. CNY236]